MYLQNNLNTIISNKQGLYLYRYDSIDCHSGCVNAIKFHTIYDKTVLLSGSDDRHLGITPINSSTRMSSRIDLTSKHKGNIISIKNFKDSSVTAANKGTVCVTNLVTSQSKLIHDDSKRIICLDIENTYQNETRQEIVYYSDVKSLRRHDLSEKDGVTFIDDEKLDDKKSGGITAVSVNQKRSYYLGVGCRNGSSKIFDIRWSKKPLFQKLDSGVASLKFNCAYQGKKSSNDHEKVLKIILNVDC